MKNHRQRVYRNRDRRVYSATADKTHFKNLRSVPMRGGFRL